jgi:hypothetical protein
MRQGQQHRRGRNRGSSGGGNGSHGGHSHHQRKGQNPLSRSFESNGPDVKVRGTAADVAAKYMTLARDAQSSGDPVLAENYLQHAEHYNRMIIAYREQQMQQGGGDMANGNGHRMRPVQGVDMGDGDEVEGEAIDPGMGDQPPVPYARHGQPEGQPRQENGRHEDRRPQHGRQQEHRQDYRQDRQDRQDHREPRQDRSDNPRFRDRRFDRGDRSERHERGERPERSERPEYRGDRPERIERTDAPAEQPPPVVREASPVDQPQPIVDAPEIAPREQPAPRRRNSERFDMMKDQPEFLRRPVRRPRREEPPADSGEDTPSAAAPQEKPNA